MRVSNDFEKELRTATGVLKSAEAAVNATIQTRSFNQETVLEEVNRNRRLLGGDELSSAHSGGIKSGLRPPASAAGEHNFNVSLFERDVENIRKLLLPDNRKRLGECDRQLRALISLIQGDQEMLRAMSLQQLTELGLALLDETGSCPLCDTPWPPGKLCDHLEGRISAAKIAREYRAKVKRLSEDLASSVNTAVASISKVSSACESVGLSQDKPALEEWLEELKSLSADLANAAERYPRPGQAGDRVPGLLAPDALDEILERITSSVKAKYPDASPEQTAWDTLTRLEVTLKGLEDAVKAHSQAQVRLDKAALLLKSFQEARDSVLEKLYAEIRDRFIGLYREIHGTDEGEFTAKLEHDEAKLNLEVEFFGRGMHPPHALHSEGHQDSMGLCLYLALAEHLTKGVVELIILDDVVMSVDADHRLEICRVLSSQFPTRQFFITTHDRTWASQLKYEGVVRPGDWLEFYNWQIESGPQVNCETDIWDRIEADLLRNDVTSAAAKLRRAAEEYLAMACDALGGKVSFKLNGRWELGDFFPGARDQYKKLLREGKRAASSWDDRSKVEQLGELESTAGRRALCLNRSRWRADATTMR